MNSELELGRKLKNDALDALNARRTIWLSMVRCWAIRWVQIEGTVSINEIRDRFTLPAGYHKSTWGAIFKCKELKPIGYTQANHKEAHARAVRVYSLRTTIE